MNLNLNTWFLILFASVIILISIIVFAICVTRPKKTKMGDSLELLLRYNARPDNLKILIEKTDSEHKQIISDIFGRNQIHRNCVYSVHLLDKPFQPYTAFIEFDVTLRSSASAAEMWKHILSSWAESNIWLSPQQNHIISEREFNPPTTKEIVLDSFSFGTILDGYKYIRQTRSYSQQAAPEDYNLNNEFSNLFGAYHSAPSVVRFSFNNKMLYLFFNGNDNDQLYYIELSWTRDLEKRIIIREDTKTGVTHMYFQMHLLPKIFQADTRFHGPKKQSQINITPAEYVHGNKNIKWMRKCVFPDCKKEVLGNCTALELVIPSYVPKSSVREIMMYMKRLNGLEISYCNVLEILPTPKQLWTALYKLREKNFDVYWALKTLYSRGYWVIETLVVEAKFKRYLQMIEDDKKLIKALYSTASFIETERYVDIIKVFEHYLSIEDQVPIIKYHGLEHMKSIVCTPLRIIFFPPVPVKSSRILRDYDTEYFVRVSFRDEDMNRIMFGNPAFYNEVVYNRLSQPMMISDRQYTFLACSNSQLRSHGVWYYSTDKNGITAEYIRSQMGDLSRIENVASYVSRMGQCFTNTELGTTTIRDEWLSNVPDVERNGYCFSDGTGMISTELRNQVAKTLGHQPRSLYQIRFGGAKGTVALNPKLKGKKLVIRKSMKKFDSNHNELEICEEADACRLYLNHQSIMLLEQLGVPRDIFLELQEKAVFDLLDMMLYEKTAARMIDHRTIPHIKFQPLVAKGVSLITDPFIRKILLLVLYKTIDSIKSQGRIELPLEYARNLMGTMDTTGTLQYGEVFVQYSKNLEKQGQKTSVLTGDVIITKFPAVHKGDMRRFWARDVPALRHMVDCIVFPSKGHRPHPDEMAGSDLDGDDYFVTWLPEFLDNFQRYNQEPMDFSSEKKILGRPVTMNDIYRYITDYVQNDNLGKISNALKAFADKEDEGFFSEKCETLAHKHSQAVDFPKTEIPVELERDEIATVYPDFMGKQGISCVYNSNRVLGTMYRNCRQLTDIIEDSLYNDKGYVKAMEMPQILMPAFEIDEAAEIYKHYVNGLNEIMHSHGVETEEEIISGQILHLHKRMNERKDMFSTLEIVRRMVSQFKSHFRDLFFRGLGYDEEPDPLVITEEMKSKAILWYKTVYNQTGQKFVSFAWVVADIIGDVVQDTATPRQNSIERITASITTLYNLRSFPQQGAKRSLRVSMRVFGKNNAAQVAIWLFLWMWCQYQKMDYKFVREQMDMFMRRHCKMDLPTIPPEAYTRFDLLKAEGYLAIKFADICNVSIGKILLAFLRYHGSQEYISIQQGTFDKEMKAHQLHGKAMKAYFHLAVYNDCQELVSESTEDNHDNDKKETSIYIPTNAWHQMTGHIEVIKADLKEVFPGLSSVNITRNQRGRYENGTLYALGCFTEILLLERVLNEWLNKTIFSQQRYVTDFHQLKERLSFEF